MKRLILLLATLTFPGIAAAENVSMINYSFNDGDTIPISLSSLDVNRLRVKDDRIMDITCPSGFCSSSAEQRDKTGSIKLNINISAPFTAQLTTEKGRLFALFVTPKATPGFITQFTYSMAHLEQKSVFEREFDYPTALVEFTKAMMNWKKYQSPVPGFSVHHVDPNTLPKKNSALPLTPQVVFSGKDYSGIIYQVTNNGDSAVDLTTAQFYSYSARSASLDDFHLKPGESTTLYLITGGGANDFR
ncbi:type-F conjugative transfer system secretin TraK [Vibrio tubiashii]|uniref:Conjugal transfer protein TraK n=1 Tax=Vibrio tubiashii ATCC 19109 TaxID=1051646 RepID=F9T590_9VIBR|nr:type-F conjugative transfer system secretin TraK [Vibrio tubiashii]AIW17443.1 conjugal transfer protein TraK [Vibrio tubiashii ATCC 19109]EGU55287.1 type-F conjugative transfer system secretin TraK [Vibrio tubiashii ATCC 19109]EIF04431.1 type-F conjugative transfer system secretin TraK [Vibrio tubiashii NCIMB 1337 = ATCC 19106]